MFLLCFLVSFQLDPKLPKKPVKEGERERERVVENFEFFKRIRYFSSSHRSLRGVLVVRWTRPESLL
jgi:hypothetical protein